MRIAIIEQGYRKYLLDMFAQHPRFEAEIVCFAEWEELAQSDKNISVIPLSELKEEMYDAVLVAVSSNHRLSQLLTYLHDKNISNVYIIRLFALDTRADFITDTGFDMFYVDKMPEQGEPPYLVHLETHVCDHCNLNCKACNNFSPFVKEPICTDVAQFEEDLRYLAGLFSNIGRFFLLGGEPLLEPERCCEMVEAVRKYFPNTELRLLTNAILVPQMTQEFWDCLRKYKVIVHISVYPPVLAKLDEIEAILQKNRVMHLLAKKIEKFAKHWTLYPFEDEKFNNNDCGSAGCHYLRNGVLSKCPDGILIGNIASTLDCSPEALQTQKRITLSSAADAWNIIRDLDAPSDMCKKCSRQRKVLVAWEPAGTCADPSDWLIENRLEYENQQLGIQLQDITEKMEKIKASLQKMSDLATEREEEVKTAISEMREKDKKLICITQRKEKLTDQLQNKISELQTVQQEADSWHIKFDEINSELQNTEQRFVELKREHSAVLSSLSFRLGRVLTWLPRRVLGRK